MNTSHFHGKLATYMIDYLVRYATIVLKDVEVLGAGGLGDLLRDGLSDLER